MGDYLPPTSENNNDKNLLFSRIIKSEKILVKVNNDIELKKLENRASSSKISGLGKGRHHKMNRKGERGS
jgi:hypothetical protein